MKSFVEYDQFDGIGLANIIREKQISDVEVIEEAIRRAEELNPKLNAIITPLYDFAREAVKRIQPDAFYADCQRYRTACHDGTPLLD